MNNTQTTYSAVLGVVIANLRKEKCIEQNDMAAKMGLSQASYSRLENGKAAFSVDQMYQSAAALGVSRQEISRRLDSMYSQLEANGVTIVSRIRGNTTVAKQNDFDVGEFVIGAALGALLISLLTRK